MKTEQLTDGISSLIETLQRYKAKKIQSAGFLAAARSGATFFRQFVGGASQSSKLEIIDQTVLGLQKCVNAL